MVGEHEEWLTVEEASRFLKVARRTLYKYCESGQLPYYRIGGGGHRRLRKSDVAALMVRGQPASGFGFTPDRFSREGRLDPAVSNSLALQLGVIALRADRRSAADAQAS